MTTFTTEDRIIAEQNCSVTINVEPIPFAGLVTLTETAPKSEPVAWTDGKGHYFDKNSFFPVDDLTPLYAHPAKTLTDEELGLTDVEISLIAEEFTGADGLDVVDFGRAILRKAQEK
jgi:hypothetical protein